MKPMRKMSRRSTLRAVTRTPSESVARRSSFSPAPSSADECEPTGSASRVASASATAGSGASARMAKTAWLEATPVMTPPRAGPAMTAMLVAVLLRLFMRSRLPASSARKRG